ncbi:MAG: hypothetical protein H6741_18360 [Alphaproteobacteria bacterium]|nr:hypothetical protein [Alphaproteobacteria bacterium]MCB9794680.1 hypothetical protein [Alphaproteobacteria bacterium]
MLSLALLAHALAAPDFEPLPTLERPVLAAAAKGSGSQGKATSKKKNKAQNNEPHWKTEPYFAPRGGVRVYSSNGSTNTVATLGGVVGYQYRYVNAGKPQWRGYTRASADLLASGDSSQGMELRGGSFMGPHWKLVGVESGVDVFWNRWTYGNQTLAPSLGAELPIRAMVHQKGFSGYAGVASAWLQDESRRVDWSTVDVPGFGHEFAYFVGASGTVMGVQLGLQGEYRITAAGPISTAMASATVDGTTLQDIIDLARGQGGSSSGDSSKGSERK